MPIVRIAEQPATPWRPGQTLRQAIGADEGSTSLSMQHFTVHPGSHTPLHRHDVDEAILLLSGCIDVYIDDAWRTVGLRRHYVCFPREALTPSPAPATAPRKF